MVTSNCATCGKQITARGFAPAVYCSKACQDTRKPKPCGRCGKEMLLPRCIWERTIYCSRACRRHRMPMICAFCGKTFEIKASHADSTRCCSRSCDNHYRVKIARTSDEPAPVDGCRWIPLTKGRFALIDEQDYELVSQYPWQANDTRGVHKTIYAHARIYSNGMSRAISMHRLIMGEPSGFEIDHANMNGLDNRRANLRQAVKSQQRANQIKRQGASKFKGVSRNNSSWEARIGSPRNNTRTRLGTFTSEEEAARAYDAAAREKYGEFARLNFPLPGERSAIE